MNILNTFGLYTQKWFTGKRQVLCNVYFTTVKKWKKKSEAVEDQITTHYDGEAQGGQWDRSIV